MIFLLRPLTKTLLAELRKARAIELSRTEKNICVADDFKGSLAELCRRGFVGTKMVILDGKEILSVYITQAGKLLLDEHPENVKKWGSAYNIF
jgi:hypothetical protein